MEEVNNNDYPRLKQIAIALAVLSCFSLGLAGYYYSQLNSYRAEKTEFEAYKKDKEANQQKLEKLQKDNEKMLRDMSEISNLEKKLRRAIIRDVDSSKLLGEQKDSVSSEVKSGYTPNGKGGNRPMDVNSTLAVLEAQNKNINGMISATKTSVSQLLGEVEGKSGAASSFPDRWPLDGGFITSDYGGRSDPVSGGYEYHQGLDIGADYGAPVYAAGAGSIAQAGPNGGYGNYARIDHGNGYETAYGHMSAVVVDAGQKVAKGDIIGFVGSTGYSTGPHLHFEVFVDGQSVDPYYVTKAK